MTTRGWLVLLWWGVFFFALLLRNLPDSALRRTFAPYDRHILTKLGMYHRGWGMFPGPGTGALIVQVRFTWQDGSSDVEQYFPLRSSVWRSAWNEVMEDLAMRDDNNDTRGEIVEGYFRYQCVHAVSDYAARGPLKSIQFEQAWVPLHEIMVNRGHPFREPKFSVTRFHECGKT